MAVAFPKQKRPIPHGQTRFPFRTICQIMTHLPLMPRSRTDVFVCPRDRFLLVCMSFSCRTAMQNRLLRRRIHVFAGQQPIFLRHCLLHDDHCLRQQSTPIFNSVPTSCLPKTLTDHSLSIRTKPRISPAIRRVARLPSSVSLRSTFVLGVSLSRKGHNT